MIGTRLFRKHLGVTALILILFVSLGFLSTAMVMKLSTSAEQAQPSVFLAKLLDAVSNGGSRLPVLERIASLDASRLPVKLHLLDESGRVLYPPGVRLPFRWEDIEKPAEAHDPLTIRPASRFGLARHALLRLSGSPTEYLYVEFDPRRTPLSIAFLTAFGTLIVSVLLGAGVSVFLLFRTLHEKALLADSVITELQRGNLKARFPITRMDDVGQAMSRFNRMAEEIERLVEQLRSTERARTTLLQELAHDLRTPVASLKNLLETLDSRRENIKPELREELMALSLREVEYFERLVEDLLVLAQVSEPRYQMDRKLVNLNELLDEEAEAVAGNRDGADARASTIELRKSIPETIVEIPGDPHLLRRLFRNGLENAFSFAGARVNVSLQTADPKSLEVLIEDDGPGVSDDALKAFGERRTSRVADRSTQGRLSVGLGSVIMRTVARMHLGEVSIRNRLNSEGRVAGASLRISLPRG